MNSKKNSSLTTNKVVKHYTYRLKEEDLTKDNSKIAIQETAETLQDGDIFLVFVSGTLQVLGIYTKIGDYLNIDKKIDNKKLSDLYSCFSMITFVDKRTYKIFSRRVKEIEKEDYENILKHSQPSS